MNDQTEMNGNPERERSVSACSGEFYGPSVSDAERHFRWAYALLVELAKEELARANANREDAEDWPAGQEWESLVGTSKSIFLRKARERAGIDHDKFLALIREGIYDVSDIYDRP